MKIFITGANGQLAKSLIEVLPNDNLYLATKEKLDVVNKRQVLGQIKKFKPDIILHLASMTRGEECAKDPQKAYAINVVGTKNVVEACKINNSSLLFVSSNEVFDGEKRLPYKEEDTPNPITVVGKNKHEAENIIKENLKKYYIVRTSWLYSQWSANFLHAVLSKARENKSIVLVQDEISSPTYSQDLANAIKSLIHSRKYGIYHLSNSGSASRLEFAKKAFQIYGIKNIKIIPVRLGEYPRLSRPPLFSSLENIKAKELGITLPTWKNALKRFLVSVKI